MHDTLFAGARRAALRVALPVPIDSLFDYEAPAGESPDELLHRRVVVPFSGRRLTGLVVALVDADVAGDRHGRLARIEQVLDDTPVVSAELVEVLLDAARDSLCPPGIALQPALPPGAAPRMIRQLALTPRGRRALESGAARAPALALLRALAQGARSPRALARGLRVAPEALRALERDGLARAVVSERAPSARLARERVALLAEGIDAEGVEIACREALSRAPRQAAMLRRIAAQGPVPTSLLARTSGGASSALRALAERGFVRLEERETPRDVLGQPVEDAGDAVELTREQRDALAPISDAIGGRRFASYLLHGVTGSGKTEVYLRAVAAALAAGRQALVLVPEITLTHQIIARLRARFGDELAILHSGLRPGERLEQWWRVQRRDVQIAVGARSALFAPLADLGVIVVDEEHDPAYKSDEGFRYHARDLARRRAERAGCPLILGTATPSLETRYAADGGGLERLVLSRRIGGRPLPAVEVVDLQRERARTAQRRKAIVTRPLLRALQQTLDEGGQSIVFLNRRGFSTQIFCFECGFAERCKNCDVALVYHAEAAQLRCHYCDFAKTPPRVCGGCGAPDTALLGVGTERLEEEVHALLPDARLARLDRDTASQRGYTESVLRGLRDGHLDVLIGTQIVAKGHDLPGVRLVGVIAADLGLHLPDFRAAERTFQLLTQVAGRAGRSGLPGRVVLQTFVPDHYAIAPVVEHDYERFYAHEIEQRAALGYPPFGALVQVTISSEEADACESAAAVLGTAARASAESDTHERVEVLGPAPAALARLRGRHRFQLLLKGRERGRLLAVARAVREAAAKLPRAVQTVVDVDPVSML